MVSNVNRVAARSTLSGQPFITNPHLTISVALCTYNGADFIAPQLLSVTRQSRLPEEIIICDDGSTDATAELSSLLGKASTVPVRFFRNASTVGCTKNFEKAISLCSGDIIALCDQDDVWLPDKLLRIESEFQRRPEIGGVFSDGAVVDRNLTSMGYTLWQAFGLSRNRLKQIASGNASAGLLAHFFVTGATLAFKRSFLEHLLPIPPAWPHDAWIASVLSYIAPIVPLPRTLILYRQHGANQIGASRNFHSQFIHPWIEDQSSYFDWHIEMFKTLHRHLVDRDLASSLELDALAKKVQHLEFRKMLPANRLLRIPLIIRSLCHGEYDAYSRHRLSAFRDLLSLRPER